MPPSLLDYLTTQLQRNAAGVHPRVIVDVLRSDPQRSHALFPHATNAKLAKVYHEDIFVVLSLPVPVGATDQNENEDEHVVVPIVGIEAALYTIPATQTSLLYISKVDTTGLASARTETGPRRPNPTRPLVAGFLSYFLLHPPHNSTRVRIHIFARAQSQYLFPGSVDNEEKKILDDKGLIRWWKRTIELAVSSLPSSAAASSSSVSALDATPRLFYLIPGLSYLESLPYVPAASQPATSPPWTYSHPHSALSSPLHPATDPPSAHPLTDHIPAFPDDPKSRFLHSLTSSSVSSSGTEGDYDDVFLALASNTFTTRSTPAQKLAETERAIERERKRLIDGVPGGVEEWWERMAFRQECCAGQLVGFFVVAAGEPAKQPSSEPPAVATADPVATQEPSTSSSTSPAISIPHHAPKRHPLSLRPTTYTKLWSQLHNFDYARPALPKLGEAVAKWGTGLEQALKAEEDLDDVSDPKGAGENANDNETEEGKNERREKEWRRRYEKFVRREFKIDNPHLVPASGLSAALDGGKRPAEQEVTKVNVLAPRKKKKANAVP